MQDPRSPMHASPEDRPAARRPVAASRTRAIFSRAALVCRSSRRAYYFYKLYLNLALFDINNDDDIIMFIIISFHC